MIINDYQSFYIVSGCRTDWKIELGLSLFIYRKKQLHMYIVPTIKSKYMYIDITMTMFIVHKTL